MRKKLKRQTACAVAASGSSSAASDSTAESESTASSSASGAASSSSSISSSTSSSESSSSSSSSSGSSSSSSSESEEMISWKHTLNSDGKTATLTGVSSGWYDDVLSGTVILPRYVKGVKITAVADFAFAGRSIEELVIPEGITRPNRRRNRRPRGGRCR